jgi:hypothetical protein
MAAASPEAPRGRPGPSAAPLLLLLVAASPAPLSAQALRSSIDLGGLSVSYPGFDGVTGVQVAPFVSRATRRSYLELGGSGARYDDGSWSGQGSAVAAWRFGALAGITPEAGAGATLSGATGSERTTQGWGRLRLFREAGAFTLWVGGGGGRSSGAAGDIDFTSAEAGLEWRRGAWQADLIAVPTFAGPGRRYTDGQLALRWEERIALGLVGGGRTFADGGGSEGWVTGSAEVPVTAWGAVVATGGSYPADPTLGLPRGRFVSLAFRIGRNDRGPALPPRAARLESATPPWPEAAFRVERHGSELEFRLAAPAAGRVELAGDFTDWRPVSLVRDGRWWRVRLPVPVGVHHLNVRLDGGAWMAPPGIPAAADEFGGRTGVLVVD